MKEDFKLILSVVLFLVYSFFCILCAYATVILVKKVGFGALLTGGILTTLLVIPAYYIFKHSIYEPNKEFFDNLLK